MNTAQNESTRRPYRRIIAIWLGIGVFMVFMQVVIGGITRLTGSGLSITKWEIITGTLPPLNAHEWDEAFKLYQETPQYQKINEGMSMGEFKFIYFWEYFHRLWARTMGFVFAIPFVLFWLKGWLDRPLMRRLGIVVLMAAFAASFGWIMVASGLVDRPWVNAYKLTLHLSIALVLYGYLFWTFLKVAQPYPQVFHSTLFKNRALLITVILAAQIVVGGVMSGMKAGLFYPTWPDMNGEWIPSILFSADHWTMQNFIDYDKAPFMSALVQIVHRTLAYLLIIIVLWYLVKGLNINSSSGFRTALLMMTAMFFLQALLGVITVISCKGTVPVSWGVFHQAGALLLLTATLYLNYQLRENSKI